MRFQVIIELLLLISFNCFLRIQFLLEKLFLLLISFKFLFENLLCLHSMQYRHLSLTFIIFFNYIESICLDLLSDSSVIKLGCSTSLVLLSFINVSQVLVEIWLWQLRCICWIQPMYFKVRQIAKFIIILWNFPSKLWLALIWLVFSFILLFDLLKKWLSIVNVFNIQSKFSKTSHPISW